jgi:hypothetical protein
MHTFSMVAFPFATRAFKFGEFVFSSRPIGKCCGGGIGNWKMSRRKGRKHEEKTKCAQNKGSVKQVPKNNFTCESREEENVTWLLFLLEDYEDAK